MLRFVVYTCVAVILGKREALLATDKQFSLAEAGLLLHHKFLVTCLACWNSTELHSKQDPKALTCTTCRDTHASMIFNVKPQLPPNKNNSKKLMSQKVRTPQAIPRFPLENSSSSSIQLPVSCCTVAHEVLDEIWFRFVLQRTEPLSLFGHTPRKKQSWNSFNSFPIVNEVSAGVPTPPHSCKTPQLKTSKLAQNFGKTEILHLQPSYGLTESSGVMKSKLFPQCEQRIHSMPAIFDTWWWYLVKYQVVSPHHQSNCRYNHTISYPGLIWWYLVLVGGFKHFLFSIIYGNIRDNPSHWLIFFKMVKSTNQEAFFESNCFPSSSRSCKRALVALTSRNYSSEPGSPHRRQS